MANANRGRAGRYVKQQTGYRAFISQGLPPSPPIRMDQDLWSLLSHADRALGRLDGSTEILPDSDLFVYMYVRKEAVLSSQIEGTQASLLDVLEFEAKARESDHSYDIEEVVNYVTAMNHGLRRLQELPVSLRLIREIHEKLLAGVRGSERRPGEFRSTQNWIGTPDGSLADATFVPPPPHAMRESLHDLEKFIHSREPLPVLVKVGLIHSQFETIHPFLDGNGRVGRLLITFFLCEQNILRRPLLYLSYFFRQNKSEYYDRLQAVRDHGDWEGWLRFFFRGVYEVAQEATATARLIVNLREEHRKTIARKLRRGAPRALGLLESLFLKPIVTVNTVADLTGLAYTNANRVVGQLCELGILVETTGRTRNRRFSYNAYLRLFTDRETETPEVH